MTAALVLAVGLLPLRAVEARVRHEHVTWRTFATAVWTPRPLRDGGYWGRP